MRMLLYSSFQTSNPKTGLVKTFLVGMRLPLPFLASPIPFVGLSKARARRGSWQPVVAVLHDALEEFGFAKENLPFRFAPVDVIEDLVLSPEGGLNLLRVVDESVTVDG